MAGTSFDGGGGAGVAGSPFFDDLRQDKDLRNSFLHAIALTILAVILTGVYYVYSILEPFIVPLFWALLSGVLLHPYKKGLTTRLRQSLMRLEKNDKNVLIAVTQNTLKSIDGIAEYIGEYFLEKWKLFVSLFVSSVTLYTIFLYTPHSLAHLLGTARNFLMVCLPSLFESVQNVHLGVSCTLWISTIVIIPQYKVCCTMVSVVTWVMIVARVFNFLWPPLLYIFILAVVLGYSIGSSRGSDEPDGGGESRVRELLLTVLRKANLVQSIDEADSKEKVGSEEKEARAEGPAASTPIPNKVVEVEGTTPRKLDVMPHPGVSALKKEHGVLVNRPNVSEIGKITTPIGSNTPRSRLGRSFRFAKRKSSLAAEIHHDSMRYIYWVLWCCCLIQLWLHPGLLHLLPAPIFYSLIKRLLNYTGAFEFVCEQAQVIEDAATSWFDRRADLILPRPVRFTARMLYNVERVFLQGTLSHVDSIVTIVLIFSMVLLTAVAGVFISIQVYAESAYILQSLASIASSLNMEESLILSSLNISLPENSSMEAVMDEAYTYGRGWISSTLRETLSETDEEIRLELENKVLELWDRSYQYWILKQDVIGPKVSSGAVSTSFGEVMDKLYHSQNIFNIAAIQIFVRNNMGTLTSILEHVWSLFQGNFIFLLDTVMGVARVLLHSGSGFINFVFGIVIYLTALFYLLSNSSATYKPMEIMGQYTLFHGSGVGSVLQTAVNSVLFLTVKMSSFYLLWTYLTHTLFQATIVVLPMLSSSFIAAVPFTGQYIVALPASLELWLLQDRPIAAILLILVQIGPSWLVDAAIYSEMKGGIHPWFTGLAVVGGVYLFGVVGAVYGPLALCVLYVLVTLYSTFMQELEPPTPMGFKSMRTPLNRSDTVM